jgi:hypothetical protein
MCAGPLRALAIFASRPLAERLVECRAVDLTDPDPWAVSDHCPVVGAPGALRELVDP